MIGWLLGEFGGWIIGAAVALFTGAGLYIMGGSKARSGAKLDAAEGYIETTERINDATLGDNPSPDALRERLHTRPTDQR